MKSLILTVLLAFVGCSVYVSSTPPTAPSSTPPVVLTPAQEAKVESMGGSPEDKQRNREAMRRFAEEEQRNQLGQNKAYEEAKLRLQESQKQGEAITNNIINIVENEAAKRDNWCAQNNVSRSEWDAAVFELIRTKSSPDQNIFYEDVVKYFERKRNK
jgi:hypothetical protein